jgi:hypothetical protein
MACVRIRALLRYSIALGSHDNETCPATNFFRGASPLGLPDTLSRAPLRRRAPVAVLAADEKPLHWVGSSKRDFPGTLCQAKALNGEDR